MGKPRVGALVVLHVTIFAAGFAVGVGSVWHRAGSVSPARFYRGYWVEVTDIATHNLGAAAFLVSASVLTAGLGGALLTASNGYAFGSTAGAAGLEPPLALYAPAEILVFATIAALAADLSRHLITWLRSGGSPPSAPVVHLAGQLAGAAALLVPVAALEALAISLRAAR